MLEVQDYVICRMLIDDSPTVPSDEAEYKACVSAVDGLTRICDVEETYEILIENYIEWENAIGLQTLRQMVSFEIGHIEIAASRKLVARRLANLLASARLYLDSLPQHTKRILPGNKGALAQIEEAPRIQYDARLSYRVMEALRNYSQHAALPIHGVSTHASRKEATGELTFAVLPHVDHQQLAEDGKFKKAVLDEIQKLERIELKPMVREYVEGISAVHKAFRMITEFKRKAWTGRLESATKRFNEQFPSEHRVGLAILPLDAEGLKAAEETYIDGPVVRYLDQMQRRYGAMFNLARRKMDY
jgi:hypothetical protein